MSLIRNGVFVALCLFAVLMLPGSLIAAPAPKQHTALSAYLLTTSPNVTSRAGLPIDGNIANTSSLRFDPMLLKFAGDGSAQNIRLTGDGTISLLATDTAAQQLQARGSTLVPVAPIAPIAPAGSSDRPLSGVISGTVNISGGAGIAGATVSAFLGTTVVTTTTTAASGTYSL